MEILSKTKGRKISDPKREEIIRNRLEINNTLILSVAALAITWCNYQSTLWSGIQNFKIAVSNSANRQAMEKTLNATQYHTMDESILISFINAVMDQKSKRAEFYMNRARPELAKIMKDWQDTQPLKNSNSGADPRLMQQYNDLMKEDLQTSRKLRQQSESYMEEAQTANANADHYVLFTVIFSLVMFLGAIATKMTHARISFGLIIFSGLICIVILILLFFSMPLARE